MCCSTFVCRRVVAITASARMNPSRSAAPGPAAALRAPRRQTPEPAIRLGRMRHQKQLVRGMKPDERRRPSSAVKQAAQPPVGEHPLDEDIAEPRIGQPTFFFDGQVREALDERRGEEPRPLGGSACGRRP